MKQDKLIELLCELIKNSRRSDRDLAKILSFSQSSVSRLRKILEKEAILQYTAIPNLSYLGFDILAFTFYRMKEHLQFLNEKAEKWIKQQPNVVFSSEGEGMETDKAMISMHRDYVDFSKFQQKFRKEWSPQIENFKTFIISFTGHGTLKPFTFNDLLAHAMPNLSIIDFQKWKHSIPFDLLKTGPVLNFKEGDSIIATYTSAADKMRIFSAFIREGLENGDAVEYVYPDDESETVRAKLKEYGINVEEYEKDGTLQMKSVTEYFMTDGKFDPEKGFNNTIKYWDAAKKKGYNHARNIEDVGDFSFINEHWQKYITEYWLNPKFSYSSKPPWKKSKKSKERVRVVDGVLYSPFLIDITAINIESMSEAQIHNMLKTFDRGKHPPTRLINLLEHADTFSKRIGISHQELLGRKILFEFDPISDYENIVDDFVKEAMANAEATPAFTYAASIIHKCLAKHPTIKFFKMSTSTSNIQPESENEILIPAGNIDLILDFIAKVTKTYSETNVSIVFDGLSDLLISTEPEKTLTFLRNTLQILSSKRTTALFLLNTSAHDPKTVSRLRSLFYTQLAYGKDGLQIIKLPKLE